MLQSQTISILAFCRLLLIVSLIDVQIVTLWLTLLCFIENLRIVLGYFKIRVWSREHFLVEWVIVIIFTWALVSIAVVIFIQGHLERVAHTEGRCLRHSSAAHRLQIGSGLHSILRKVHFRIFMM